MKVNKIYLALAKQPLITQQLAIDNKYFGPVYHGAPESARQNIHGEGFKVFIGPERNGEVTNGLEPTSRALGGLLVPVHWLGFGVYLTTVKTIAKMFNGNTVKGLKTYYVNCPRLLTINYGSMNTMYKWWLQQGFNPDLAKIDRVKATVYMTEHLKQNYDAVWFKGKGLHRLLDGDQICVFNPKNIYEIDNSKALPFEIGSKVRRKTDGMIGLVVRSPTDETNTLKLYPGAAVWLKPETKFTVDVKWKKGGVQREQDVDIEAASFSNRDAMEMAFKHTFRNFKF